MNKKKIVIIELAVLLVFLFSINVFAKDTLKNDDKGFWLENEENRYYVNTWMWVDYANDGIYYHCYFGDDGYMLVNTIAPDGTMINEFGQGLLDGVPITYKMNVTNRTNNTSKYIINIGDYLQDAINMLQLNGIDYSTPISNCFEYYDNEGKGHIYYFNANGICVVDIDIIQCDAIGANVIMNDRISKERAPLVNHYKEGNKEINTYMRKDGYDNIYGRLLGKNISNGGWHIFCDLMFDMDYYDLLTVWSKIEEIIYK